MFTGIIEATGTILETTPSGLTIERPSSFDDVKLGSSISVSGVCLSIVELTSSSMRFDVVDETWAKTNLRGKKKGDRVNLERAMSASGRLDGHIVQGHVEGVGDVLSGPGSGSGSTLIIQIPAELLSSIVTKGSIAIEGVSLTIAFVDHDQITIALIPHTLELTTLGLLGKGDSVNIETDMLLRRRS